MNSPNAYKGLKAMKKDKYTDTDIKKHTHMNRKENVKQHSKRHI